jgi:hypothetical protein
VLRAATVTGEQSPSCGITNSSWPNLVNSNRMLQCSTTVSGCYSPGVWMYSTLSTVLGPLLPLQSYRPIPRFWPTWPFGAVTAAGQPVHVHVAEHEQRARRRLAGKHGRDATGQSDRHSACLGDNGAWQAGQGRRHFGTTTGSTTGMAAVATAKGTTWGGESEGWDVATSTKRWQPRPRFASRTRHGGQPLQRGTHAEQQRGAATMACSRADAPGLGRPTRAGRWPERD